MAPPYAFVTLLTSDSYLPGALTLAAALRDIHPSPSTPPEVDFQTVCLVTPEAVDVSSIKLLRKAFNVVIGVEIIEEDNARGLQLLGRPDLTTVLTKLHVFRLVQYSKIIFLDADVLPIRPLSHLFTLPHDFSAVPDVGWPDIFNSGLMVLSPGEDKFQDLMTLSGSKGSWDGGDQGLLNEWRGNDWNRLSFTYNTTPTAVYTYAPAYERFGSQISAIHFIGANKPWSSIPWRAPGSTSAQQVASQPLQVYDYGSLVDRWYAVYDRHYRSEPVIPQTDYASARYEAAWDQSSNTITSGASAVPTTSVLTLEELRRIAIEGFAGFAGASRTSHAQGGEGEYISLPLEGRMDLMRPRREPTEDHEPDVDSADQQILGNTVGGGQGFDDQIGSSTPRARPASFQAGELPHDHPFPDSGPQGYLPTPYLTPLSNDATSPIPNSYGQPETQPSSAAGSWQNQLGLTIPNPPDVPRYYPPGSAPPRGYPAQIQGNFATNHPQGTSGNQNPDVQGQDVAHAHAGQPYIDTGHPYSQPGQTGQGSQSFPVYPPSPSGFSQVQHQPLSPTGQGQGQRPAYVPYHPMQGGHGQPPQASHGLQQAPSSMHRRQMQQQQQQQQTYQPAQRSPQSYYQALGRNDAHGQGQGHAAGTEQQRPQYSPAVRVGSERARAPGEAVQPLPRQEPPRPASPPMMTWNPAVEPPPNTAPVSNFPTDTYYPNVWDQSRPHHQSDSSPSQDTSSTLFTLPPPARIPERLLQEKHYANVLGEGDVGESPSPDRAKIKPIFPWEDKPRLTPGRVFPSTDSPPPGQFLLPIQTATPQSPSPPLHFSPTQVYTSSPPSGFPPSFSYSNAWDTVPSIQKYASRLVRSPPLAPPLAPPFDITETRRRESKLFRSYQESGESSMDGDDEDTEDEVEGGNRRSRSGSLATQPYPGGKGKKKEYRSQGVQTVPKETRHQSVQVAVLTDPADADPSVKDKEKRPPRLRQSSYSGVSPTISKYGELPPSPSAIPESRAPGLGYVSEVPKRISPLTGSPTGMRSPRYASPRGSSTNLAESVPTPTVAKPTPRNSTPLRGGAPPPASVSRTISSDTTSSPSSAGPPASPLDPLPTRRAAGRVWDPARGVDIFKKGSEEVLARFLRMGSWDEERRSQSPT
ncbi:hypothetical protein BC834DRAFT_917003 [Gloeopeniophorella convolvens]|nr:hypothetical protein BC834DRAFT_917003 [Gloeopeniophorella convolvens]